jgi:(1->4)-alpha-D-glucan 1-alpha-D-glucosylmutase
VLAFARKVQQFTAPVTAKGVEDTAFYRYNRLVSLNDVGGDPDQFGVPVSAFHGASLDRGTNRPHTMLATSTHDNKRSEDVRARIDVLSEMPQEWRSLLRRWGRMNRTKKALLDDKPAPSTNDEYLLYQTLVGSLPAGELGSEELTSWSERMQAYMIKAAREAKVHTSWINPSEEYEAAVTSFVAALLADSRRNLFLKDLRALVDTIAWFGMLNSLSMTLLKLTSPGVPDIYQGNETFDLSLVDPDNRRPVDYAKRASMLEELSAVAQSAELGARVRDLARSALDGRAKMWIVWRALELRRRETQLFEIGEYVPLQAAGERADHVVAFVRKCGTSRAATIAGRLWLELGRPAHELPLGADIWGDTHVESPLLTGVFLNVLSGERIECADGRLRIADVYANFPGALLALEE